MKKKIFAAILILAAGLSVWGLYAKSRQPVVSILSTETIDYEITRKYVPNSNKKQIVVKFTDGDYETIISIGVGYRISSVRNIKTDRYDMYMSEGDNPLLIIDKYPSDEEIIARYTDFKNDRFTGHYGEPSEAADQHSDTAVTVP